MEKIADAEIVDETCYYGIDRFFLNFFQGIWDPSREWEGASSLPSDSRACGVEIYRKIKYSL